MWEHTSQSTLQQGDAELETAVLYMSDHNYYKFKITNGDLIYWPEKLECVKVT